MFLREGTDVQMAEGSRLWKCLTLVGLVVGQMQGKMPESVWSFPLSLSFLLCKMGSSLGAEITE